MTEPADRDSHRAARDRFPEYATAIALGRSPAREFPQVAAHLAGCAACRDELAELLDLLAPTYTGVAAPLPAVAPPDLAFLRPARATATRPPWHRDPLGRLVITLGEALAAALAPAPCASATRGTLLHTLTAADPALQATVELWQDDPALPLARLRVAVDQPARDPLDQAGLPITLVATSGEQRILTDELGHAEFPALPLAALATCSIVIDPGHES